MAAIKELPILPFASASSWEVWLSEHHAEPDGIRIKVANKALGIASVTHDEAPDLAAATLTRQPQGRRARFHTVISTEARSIKAACEGVSRYSAIDAHS